MAKDYRSNLEYKSQIHYNKLDYNSNVGINYLTSQIVEFFGSKSRSPWAYYTIPPMSNAPENALLKFKRYIDFTSELTETNFDGEAVSFVNPNYYKTVIVSKLRDAAIAEYKRIQQVRSRKEARDNGNAVNTINNFDNRGLQFVNFPYLNDHIERFNNYTGGTQESAESFNT